MDYKDNLNQEKMTFCLVQALINDAWVPMGLTRVAEGINDYDGAGQLSEELCKTGRITCIVPTEKWSFVTLDTRAFAIKITPFTEGPKNHDHIMENYNLLEKKLNDR